MTVVFTDDFTGTNGDPWNATKWPTITKPGSEISDIQSNEGRVAGDGTSGYVTVEANSATDLQDMEVLFSIDPQLATGDTQTVDCFLRASGSLTNGLPANGFYVGFYLDNDRKETFALRRLAASDSDFSQSANSRISNGVKLWVRFQVEDDSGDVIFRSKFWDDGQSEPSLWDVEHTDQSPGALYGATGTLMIRCGNGGGSHVFDNRIDAVQVTELNAAADQSIEIDMEDKKIRRIAI